SRLLGRWAGQVLPACRFDRPQVAAGRGRYVCQRRGRRRVACLGGCGVQLVQRQALVEHVQVRELPRLLALLGGGDEEVDRLAQGRSVRRGVVPQVDLDVPAHLGQADQRLEV